MREARSTDLLFLVVSLGTPQGSQELLFKKQSFTDFCVFYVKCKHSFRLMKDLGCLWDGLWKNAPLKQISDSLISDYSCTPWWFIIPFCRMPCQDVSSFKSEAFLKGELCVCFTSEMYLVSSTKTDTFSTLRSTQIKWFSRKNDWKMRKLEKEKTCISTQNSWKRVYIIEKESGVSATRRLKPIEWFQVDQWDQDYFLCTAVTETTWGLNRVVLR